jgi:hypothetical protein
MHTIQELKDYLRDNEDALVLPQSGVSNLKNTKTYCILVDNTQTPPNNRIVVRVLRRGPKKSRISRDLFNQQGNGVLINNEKLEEFTKIGESEVPSETLDLTAFIQNIQNQG